MSPSALKRKSPSNVPDETGNRYGRLTVVSRCGSLKGQAAWICRCDCGETVTTRGVSLRTGNTKSCGCIRSEVTRAAQLLPPGRAARNRAISNMKGNAKTRGLTWTIDDDVVDRLVAMDCHYCGCPPSNLVIGWPGSGDFVYSGIDRVDNRKGYETGNVVPCCALCNSAKNDLSVEEFEAWAIRLAARILHRKATS